MYNKEVKQALQEFLPSIPSTCKELGVKIHFAVTAAPDHIFYLLVEVDDYSGLCTLLSKIPMKQEFDIKPVRLIDISSPT